MVCLIRQSSLACLIYALFLGVLPAQSTGGIPDLDQMSSIRDIKADLRPTTIRRSHKNRFWIPNADIKHNIAVFSQDFVQQALISDKVNLSDFGYSNYKGEQKGSPVDVAFTKQGDIAWVVNNQMYGSDFNRPGGDWCPTSRTYDRSFVYKFETQTQKLLSVIEVGCSPKNIATTLDEKYLLVSNWCSGDVSILDTDQGKEIKRIYVGAFPSSIAIHPSEPKAYIALYQPSRIAVINLTGDSIVNEIALPANSGPKALLVAPDGKSLYVSLTTAGAIAKIDLGSGKMIRQVATGRSPRDIAFSKDKKSLYVANYLSNTVSKVLVENMTLVEEGKTPAQPVSIALDPASEVLWVVCSSGMIIIFEDKPVNMNLPSLLKEQQTQVAGSARNIEIRNQVNEKKFIVIVGSFANRPNAETYINELREKNITAQLFNQPDQPFRVSSGAFALKEQADERRKYLLQKGISAWILTL